MRRRTVSDDGFLFPGLFSNLIAGYLGSHQLYLAASSFLTLSVICWRVVLETSPDSLARIEGELVLRTRKPFSASGLPLQRPSLMLNSFLVTFSTLSLIKTNFFQILTREDSCGTHDSSKNSENKIKQIPLPTDKRVNELL